jgi:hypothetical protein
VDEFNFEPFPESDEDQPPLEYDFPMVSSSGRSYSGGSAKSPKRKIKDGGISSLNNSLNLSHLITTSGRDGGFQNSVFTSSPSVKYGNCSSTTFLSPRHQMTVSSPHKQYHSAPSQSHQVVSPSLRDIKEGSFVWLYNSQYTATKLKNVNTNPTHWVGMVLLIGREGNCRLQWFVETSVGSRVYKPTSTTFTEPFVVLQPLRMTKVSSSNHFQADSDLPLKGDDVDSPVDRPRPPPPLKAVNGSTSPGPKSPWLSKSVSTGSMNDETVSTTDGALSKRSTDTIVSRFKTLRRASLSQQVSNDNKFEGFFNSPKSKLKTLRFGLDGEIGSSSWHEGALLNNFGSTLNNEKLSPPPMYHVKPSARGSFAQSSSLGSFRSRDGHLSWGRDSSGTPVTNIYQKVTLRWRQWQGRIIYGNIILYKTNGSVFRKQDERSRTTKMAKVIPLNKIASFVTSSSRVNDLLTFKLHLKEGETYHFGTDSEDIYRLWISAIEANVYSKT